MKILSIDTSTQCASCALIDDTRLLGEIIFNYKKQHSVIMMDIIHNLLSNCGSTLQDVDGFVVSKGPGSFTGLRIGMSTIKGLSHGTKKPFVSVSTLDSLAFNLSHSNGIICSIIDALRDNVYYGIYRFDSHGKMIKIEDVSRSALDNLLQKLNSHEEQVTFIGDCTEKFKDRILNSSPNFVIASYNNNIVRASSLAFIGREFLEKGDYDNLYDSAPIYLIKSQAEREYEEKISLQRKENKE
ncbi:tRNA (adenosine(37)-N6)-threonylcarbamoyltransferase complex dimerization subunit type 1 TsaB [Oceanirhabdus seepicola]|uniref:tRNA (Adenosine(37)-N6)-threonylcarbamoyltransferase complex dimerization subunit type 1 TsaB n=1 Tax=Oceanirhabdus seepicola TaxID=2828781 RepID=A0A9J6P0N7_9CLOT|nr:tRNA (adenosine(37)-N6)-threonylcarbamoyltransferase complex dimerization subunit type 1 TsaB [Oceanirhabdus seepicola]MCM1990099.1 tRNA (adenosine(37)-N6)-threonylcarbamoyltransferase complex dimerization subunit type 1 TsaB [Oceanirhabdus seepicola]